MKKLLQVASTIALCALLVLVVNAHPGRTDGNGGHTNHSTGEYHYHHGYPAHDHYDMDGDGDLDCPYEFDDKTAHNSGSNNDTETNLDTYAPAESNTTPKNITALDVLGAMLKYLLPSILIGCSVSYFLWYLFYLFFGEQKGCSLTIISIVLISVITYICLILHHFLS